MPPDAPPGDLVADIVSFGVGSNITTKLYNAEGEVL